MQVGYFSRTPYDKSVYTEDVYQSTSPYEYIMNTDRIHNNNGCLNKYGPISGLMGAGVNSPTGDVIAASQANVDIDSIMSNRNVSLSRARIAKVNQVDVKKIKTQAPPICMQGVDSFHSRMNDPPMFYRGASINRFIDPLFDPQANIYYNEAIHTRLEAKDNFVHEFQTINTEWKYEDLNILHCGPGPGSKFRTCTRFCT